MRIITMSDSHGNRSALKKIFDKTADSGDIFVHLGDGEKELDLMVTLHPELDIRHVAGNCDWGSLSPDHDVVIAGDIRIFITHGHTFGVNYGKERIIAEAKKLGCSAALFGHTHCRYQAYEDGIYLFNPGSCSQPRDFSKPSYGFVDITPQGIFTGIVDL